VKGRRQLKWFQASAYAEMSECKRYTMSASRVQGVWSFQGWRRAPEGSGEMPTLLGTRSIAQDARDLCELDLRAQRKVA
jgi:hypothetical protein